VVKPTQYGARRLSSEDCPLVSAFDGFLFQNAELATWQNLDCAVQMRLLTRSEEFLNLKWGLRRPANITSRRMVSQQGLLITPHIGVRLGILPFADVLGLPLLFAQLIYKDILNSPLRTEIKELQGHRLLRSESLDTRRVLGFENLDTREF
jgi:hypothetical protein